MTKEEGMDNPAEPSLMGGALVRLKRKGWTTPHKEEAPAHVRKIGDIFWGRLTGWKQGHGHVGADCSNTTNNK